MRQVISKVLIQDNRGTINIGDKGEISSVIAHSTGNYPVWFIKHKENQNPYPLFLKKEQISFA